MSVAKRDLKRAKSLMANFRKWTKTRHALIDLIIPDESNMNRWYIRIRDMDGNNDEFKGGEYLAEIRAPAKYPFDPPEFYFQTPNGVYGCNTKVCISIGEYHKGDYPATLGMGGFATQLPNGMIAWKQMGGGIEIKHTDENTKRALAAESRAWNRKHLPRIVEMFEDLPFNRAWDRAAEIKNARVRLIVQQWLSA